MRIIFAMGGLVLFGPSALEASEPLPGFRVPDGFQVFRYSGPDLANDITWLHVDGAGRVVVGGRGYVRHLVDDNHDGIADRAVPLIPDPQGWVMGLLWENETLYVVADGGLKRYSHVNGRQIPKGKPETILSLKSSSEHDAHAVRRGPDGWLYWLGGNTAGVTEKTIRGTGSPVEKPMAGCLLRLTEDASQVHVVAHGFRNPYDFDFSLAGDPMTFDSDNERCVGLPWYEPCRFYRIVPGGHYGWLNPQVTQTWRRPPYYPDVIAPVCTAGRGSPTGVTCYRHTAFPRKYHGGFFYADWTFGRIWFTQPGEPTPKAELFLESTGENGFAPSGLGLCPRTGDLFVSVGGRGTRGEVYRIRYVKPAPEAKLIPYRLEERKSARVEIPGGPVSPEQLRQAKDPLIVLRAWQIAWGDVCSDGSVGSLYEGYSLKNPPRNSEEFRRELRTRFPVGEPNVDREIARMLAMLQDDDPASVAKLNQALQQQNDPIAKIHLLFCLSRLTGQRTRADTQAIADFLLMLDGEFEKHHYTRDRHWPIRMTEALVALFQHDPKLAASISGDPRYGRDVHLWLARVPGIPRELSAKAFIRHAGPKFEWSSGHVEILGSLPPEERGRWFQQLWDRGGLEDAIFVQLAKKPVESDRAKFLRGLASAQPTVVASCAIALAALAAKGESDELLASVRGLRRFNDTKTDIEVRDALMSLLELRTGEKFNDTAGWETWLQKHHPDAAKTLASPGYDAEKWKTRLAEVPWDRGNAERGRTVYLKANCAACHNAGNAVGPNLQGVAKRFSREDLFTAILDPNRDVSPRFRTTRITTVDDRVYEGIIIYEAVDGVILQTGAETTVRISGRAIAGKKPGIQSLMPVGLIDAFSGQEIADLYAYLKEFDRK